VEIPGLISGATEDRGGGRALLGVLRGADAIVFCQDASAPIEELETVRTEVAQAGIERPAIVAATKMDEASAEAIGRLRAPGLEVVPVSVLDDASVDSFRDALWRLTGLIRVFLRKHGEDVSEAVALRPPATVADAARAIHHQLEERCLGAHVWGPSARFEGQRVGREHVLADDDVVEIISPR
jgi:ribosome-interacting GTPase 1